jgi:hypothetical protein
MKACLFFISILLCGCSFNVSMAHTSGAADDVIDDNASNDPVVSPRLTIPLTPIP